MGIVSDFLPKTVATHLLVVSVNSVLYPVILFYVYFREILSRHYSYPGSMPYISGLSPVKTGP